MKLNAQTTNHRRNTLKKISMASIWITPIVQTVVLPVHAQTSPQSSCTNADIPGIWRANVDFILFPNGGGEIIDQNGEFGPAGEKLADLLWELDFPTLTITEILEAPTLSTRDYTLSSDCGSFSLGSLTFVKQ